MTKGFEGDVRAIMADDRRDVQNTKIQATTFLRTARTIIACMIAIEEKNGGCHRENEP
jgi:hypothetical protein